MLPSSHTSSLVGQQLKAMDLYNMIKSDAGSQVAINQTPEKGDNIMIEKTPDPYGWNLPHLTPLDFDSSLLDSSP